MRSPQFESPVVDVPLSVGDLVGGFCLDAIIACGGMSAVFSATHTRIGRKVAVKVLSSPLAADEQFVARFIREAKIVNKVRHPNIVDIYDFVEMTDPFCVAYIMELVAGPPLSDLLAERRLSVLQSINACVQIADALRAVHAADAVHRDLKPSNILLTGSLDTDLSAVPSVKLLDFGIAKFQDARAPLTLNGSILGTPPYMAPEQITEQLISSATDVYALGEILYEMLVGKRIFMGTQADVIREKVKGVLPRIELPARPSVKEVLHDLITSCLAYQAQDRPTIDEVEKALSRARAIETRTSSIAAVPTCNLDRTKMQMKTVTPRSPTVTKEPAKRRPRWGQLLSLMAFCFLVGTGTFFVLRSPEPAEEPVVAREVPEQPMQPQPAQPVQPVQPVQQAEPVPSIATEKKTRPKTRKRKKRIKRQRGPIREDDISPW